MPTFFIIIFSWCVLVCVCVHNFAWSIHICITSLSSKLLWILLRWNKYCFGKLHKVLAAFTAGLIDVYTEEEKDVLFKWVQLSLVGKFQIIFSTGKSVWAGLVILRENLLGVISKCQAGLSVFVTGTFDVCLCMENVTIVWHCTCWMKNLLVPGVRKLAN